MLHVPQRVRARTADLEVSLAEPDRGLRLSHRVAEFPPDGQRLLKVAKGRLVPYPGERPAKLVEHPGLAEPVADRPPALHGHAKSGHAVRPVSYTHLRAHE